MLASVSTSGKSQNSNTFPVFIPSKIQIQSLDNCLGCIVPGQVLHCWKKSSQQLAAFWAWLSKFCASYTSMSTYLPNLFYNISWEKGMKYPSPGCMPFRAILAYEWTLVGPGGLGMSQNGWHSGNLMYVEVFLGEFMDWATAYTDNWGS